MEHQILQEVYSRLLKYDETLRYKIAAKNNRRLRTIDEWRKKNHPMLTHEKNLNIIRDHYKLPSDILLTEPIKNHN